MANSSLDQSPDAWSNIVSGYELTFETLTYQFAQDVINLISIKPGEKVIDVASGPGSFSILAAQEGADVLAIDFSPGMISKLKDRMIKEKLNNIKAEVMDGQALDIPDETFDVSVSILGAIFFPDITKGMTEMRRVLRPGGRSAVVCFGDLGKLALFVYLERAIKKVIPDFQQNELPVWARVTGSDALQYKMESAGFRDINIQFSTRAIRITDPRNFWENFTVSTPPLAFLFNKLGPDKVSEIGKAFVTSLKHEEKNGIIELGAEACIGIGYR